MSKSTGERSPGAAAPVCVALIGDPGQGRTTALADLAHRQAALGRRVEGVLSRAEGRVAGGAESYALEVIGSGRRLPWARRVGQGLGDDGTSYRFDAGALDALRSWAEDLAPGADVVILDEFGRLEAAGGGLSSVWPEVVRSQPQLAVCAVRRGQEDDVARALGVAWDERIDVSDTDVAARLDRACGDARDWARIGAWGGAAGGVEIGAGSTLHALQVPLRGAMLSSGQAALLTLAARGLSRPGRVAWVAFVAAGMKAFSPGGSRVRPMVAIAMQGALFAGAVSLVGRNVVGVAIGGALAGGWAALQGFLLQYLLLGDSLPQAYAEFTGRFRGWTGLELPALQVMVLIWAALHAVPAAASALAVHAARRTFSDDRMPFRSGTTNVSQQHRGPVHAALRELSRPVFWLPFACVAAVLLLRGAGGEAIVILAFRMLVVAFLLLALLHWLRPEWMIERLRRHGRWGPARALARVLPR